MIGTRGVPARYGGFETAVEEVGQRLAARGHEVIVFCRGAEERLSTYRGMQLIHLPAMKRRTLETLSHTAASVAHPVLNGVDAAILFNAANAPLLPVLRARRIPVATHVDGLEWKRAKWGPLGRRYYRFAESLAVRASDVVIADAHAIADYYRHQFGVASRVIAYGAPELANIEPTKLAALGLGSREYHLVVARFERENHVLEIVRDYVSSSARRPLVVIGSAPYADQYTAQIEQAADARVRLLGGVWDQDLLNQLYAHCLTYLHGHSVGGTNPSLLRAAGAGAPTVAYDCVFNREVIGEDGRFFDRPGSLARQVEEAENHPEAFVALGAALQLASRRYNWDQVAAEYESLCVDLADGRLKRPATLHRRLRRPWPPTSDTRRPSVLVAHPSPDLYGSDRVLLETVSAFQQEGKQVTVTLPTDGPLVSALRERGADIRLVPTPVLRKSALGPAGMINLMGTGFRFLGPARRLIRELRPDLVFVNTVTVPGWMAVAKVMRVPVVCHVHEAEGTQAGWVKRVLYAPLLLADKLVVNSEYSLNVYGHSWPTLERRSVVVYNGVPGPAEPPVAPRPSPDPVRLLYVGRLSSRKGADVAIMAAREMLDRGLNVRLGILGAAAPGNESFERDLHDQVRAAGLDQVVEFFGFEPSIWHRVADADIILVPSVVDEPFGNTAVEAMLGQRPLIVSGTSGLREASAGFAAVRVVTPGSASAIADATESFLADWATVREMVADDRLDAERRFSPSHYHQMISRALEGVGRDRR